VKLRNNGPGLALNIRSRAHASTHHIATEWTPPIGSLPPGEEIATRLVFSWPGGVGELELGVS
jgi:hypothetical protein